MAPVKKTAAKPAAKKPATKPAVKKATTSVIINISIYILLKKSRLKLMKMSLIR